MVPKAARGAPKVRTHKALKHIRRTVIRTRSWAVGLSEPNVLILDRPACSVRGGEWKTEEVLRVDRAVRAALGLQPRSGFMVQPWMEKVPKNPPTAPVSLKYDFEITAVPSGEIALGIERPELYRIAINGVALSPDADAGWWTDRSLRRVPFDPSILRPGKNTLTLETDYNILHPGLEILYLLGNFGVRVNGAKTAVTAPVTALRIGDWTGQGLPFYSGSLGYRTHIAPALREDERLFLSVPAYCGVAVRVLVNGRDAGIIAWEPNELDITNVLGDGKSELTIEILGHRL